MNTQTLISDNKARDIAKKIVEIDPAFTKVIAESKLCTIGRTKSDQTHFSSLAASILSQQLSTKAADTIIKRTIETAGGELTPRRVAKLSQEQIRASGVSGAKSRSLTELSNVFLDKKSGVHKLHELSDSEISALLLPLFGIGRWTIEMFLMFQLGRLDVWPVGDLGVRRGWEKIHKARIELEPKKLEKLGDKFVGFRSHVAWYCWRGTELI
jgi:DNA-3-methyladenine glycosylase II